MTRRTAAKLYSVPHTTLSHWMNGQTSKTEYKAVGRLSTEIEENVVVDYKLDQDARGFRP